ncbi:COX8 domain-containing protein [Centropristis striata]|uniref:COX8 domain-containing protein n=1 Tax=Centropristis striata TaxID=184440 RepID=UPI0027DEE45C|nr:COX8 domain-containing protein [Centropristis striata]
MFTLLKRPTLTWFRLMKTIQQNHRSIIYIKPPKEKIGPVQSFFALCVFAMTLLAPAGWILHHIPDYHQRSPDNLTSARTQEDTHAY